MLYYLLKSLTDDVSAFNVFRYLTTRSGGAILTALFFIFVFGPTIIALLKIKQGRGQPIRSDGPQRHIVEKQGTPTMGGPDDPFGHFRVHHPVGRSQQPLCLGRAVCHPGVRGHRLL